MGELTETEVPPLPPELSEGGGTERRRHDGLGFDAKALPQESDYLESPEVKKQDGTENRFERRPKPGRGRWRRYTLSRIHESICIHSRPTQKIGYRAPRRMRNS